MHQSRSITHCGDERFNSTVIALFDSCSGDYDGLAYLGICYPKVLGGPLQDFLLKPAELIAYRVATHHQREAGGDELNDRGELRQFHVRRQAASPAAAVERPSR